jgi:cobalamin biosynthesis protein CobT
MKDLLKEAIADAKAVRETALANAKLALEEAFTPRLQSMLSAKLAEELSDDEEEMTEMESDEYADNDPTFGEGEEHEEAPEETEMSDSEAPEETEDDDLDLEEIIRELEMEEADGEEDMESMEENEEEDMESMEEGDYADDMSDEMDEDIDINEIIRSLREEDEEEVEEPAQDEEELEEAYNVIRFLKGKINEVNLLNAKLLYSNKLFRNFSLNEGQKMKVIENFDRAHNLREVKLVYSTLAEGFKMPSTKKVVKESFASKPVASTKPAKQVISEGAELANRFKKLAGLK